MRHLALLVFILLISGCANFAQLFTKKELQYYSPVHACDYADYIYDDLCVVIITKKFKNLPADFSFKETIKNSTEECAKKLGNAFLWQTTFNVEKGEYKMICAKLKKEVDTEFKRYERWFFLHFT